MATAMTWSAEVLGLAAFLSSPVTTCYVGKVLSRLVHGSSSNRCRTRPRQHGPVGLALLALRTEEEERDIFQHINAAYRRNSASGCSVGTADTDEDLDFCLLTPQQAFGVLGDHAPQFTKVFLNGLPFMADSAEPGMVLSVDECAYRVRATAVCRSRTSRGTSSPGQSPPSEAAELPPLPALSPLHSLHGEASCSSSCTFSACGSLLSDCGTACSNTTGFRSPASSVGAFGRLTCSMRSSFDVIGESIASERCREEQRVAGCSADREEGGRRYHRMAGQQKGGTEGPLPAAPQGPCPGASSLPEPFSCSTNALYESRWGEQRRSFSDAGDFRHSDCCEGDGEGDSDVAVQSGSSDASSAGGAVFPSDDTDVDAEHQACAGPALAAAVSRLPHRAVAGTPCVCTTARALSGGDAARLRWGSAGSRAAPLPLPPLPLPRAGSQPSAAACGADWRGGQKRGSMDDGEVGLASSPGVGRSCRQAGGLHRSATSPPSDGRSRGCAASAFRHGSGLVPPRPPRPLACATAAAAAAAAAAAPAGLCRAPALPLPDGQTPESAVPPALRYYLAQARAAGVDGAPSPVPSETPAEPIAGTQMVADKSEDGSETDAATQQGSAPSSPVRPGFVRATVEQYNTRRAQAVVCCHITPFAGEGTPRKPRSMSQQNSPVASR